MPVVGGAHQPQPEWFADHAIEAQRGREGSTLGFYRAALRLRREHAQAGTVEFSGGADGIASRISARTTSPLPEGELLLASAGLPGDGTVPASTAVWVRH